MRSAWHGKRVSEAEAQYIVEAMQHKCQNPDCGHAEVKHNVDGDALDGACSVKGCTCGQFKDLII